MTCGKSWEGRVEAGLARPPPGRGHRADEDTAVYPALAEGLPQSILCLIITSPAMIHTCKRTNGPRLTVTA